MVVYAGQHSHSVAMLLLDNSSIVAVFAQFDHLLVTYRRKDSIAFDVHRLVDGGCDIGPVVHC